MQFRRERVRVETQRHIIEGTLQLPNEGYRSRTTDFLNAHDSDFIALIDADVTWTDGAREPERQEFMAISARHVILVTELESLGVVDEPGPTVGADAPWRSPRRLPVASPARESERMRLARRSVTVRVRVVLDVTPVARAAARACREPAFTAAPRSLGCHRCAGGRRDSASMRLDLRSSRRAEDAGSVHGPSSGPRQHPVLVRSRARRTRSVVVAARPPAPARVASPPAAAVARTARAAMSIARLGDEPRDRGRADVLEAEHAVAERAADAPLLVREGAPASARS